MEGGERCCARLAGWLACLTARPWLTGPACVSRQAERASPASNGIALSCPAPAGAIGRSERGMVSNALGKQSENVARLSRRGLQIPEPVQPPSQGAVAAVPSRGSVTTPIPFGAADFGEPSTKRSITSKVFQARRGRGCATSKESVQTTRSRCGARWTERDRGGQGRVEQSASGARPPWRGSGVPVRCAEHRNNTAQ